MKKLVINTERLRVRNLQITDLADFYFYRCNAESTNYQSFDVFDAVQANDFIIAQLDKAFGKPGELVQYGIENKITGKIIGDCAIKLNLFDVRVAEIGITISHIEQQKGYAKEVLIAIVNFLFKIDGFHRVTTIVDAENLAAVRLMISVGFKQEGQFVENRFFKGKWTSEFHYAMLREDWKSLNLKTYNNNTNEQSKKKWKISGTGIHYKPLIKRRLLEF